MINGLNNDSASLVLDAAMKVNSGFKKSWDEMSCAEKLLKVLSLGLWNPTYSRSDRFPGLHHSALSLWIHVEDSAMQSFHSMVLIYLQMHKCCFAMH